MKKTILITILFIRFLTAHGQDPVFSLYFNNLAALNPALTGVNGTYNISSQFRKQWVPVINNNYNTGKANFDFSVCHNKINRHGLGLSLYTNEGGDGFLFNNYVGLDYSFFAINHSKYNKSKLLSFGLEAGCGSTYIDWSKLVFSNQLDPRDGLILGSTNTFATKNNSPRKFFDAAFGVFYRYKNERAHKNRFSGGNIGLALHHITRPNNGLAYGNTYRMPVKMTLHGGAEFPFYSNQLKNKEIIKLQLRFRLTTEFFNQSSFILMDVGNTFIITGTGLYMGFSFRLPPINKSQNNTYGASYFAGFIVSKNPQMNIAYAYENSIRGLSKETISANTTSHEISMTFSIFNPKGCNSTRFKKDPCFDF